MLRQIEWRLQNGPITKSGVLPVTNLLFWKICSSFRTSWKKLIWCTNDPNVNIRIFRKRWSLILGCFFPVSILNTLRRYSDIQNTRRVLGHSQGTLPLGHSQCNRRALGNLRPSGIRIIKALGHSKTLGCSCTWALEIPRRRLLLLDKIDIYRVQSRIQDSVSSLKWSFFAEIVNSWTPLAIFGKSSIVDVWLDSE